jgi:hypothetical protein
MTTGARCRDEDGRRGARTVRYNVSRGGVAGVGRGGGAPGDRGVARGEGLGGVGTGHWRCSARTTGGGMCGSKGWLVAAPLGTREWRVGRG